MLSNDVMIVVGTQKQRKCSHSVIPFLQHTHTHTHSCTESFAHSIKLLFFHIAIYPNKLEAASIPQMKSQLVSTMQIKATWPILHYTYHYKPLCPTSKPPLPIINLTMLGYKMQSCELTSRRDRLIIDLMSAPGRHIHLWGTAHY